MPLSLSRRAARTVQSEIRAMSIACENVQGINLAQGVCDTEVPLPVREGAKQAMDQGINSYTRAEGLRRSGRPSRKRCSASTALLAIRDRSCGRLRRNGRILCCVPGAAESWRRGHPV